MNKHVAEPVTGAASLEREPSFPAAERPASDPTASDRVQRLLSRTGAVAGIGGWEVDLVANEVIWTSETRRIHGVDEDYRPTIEDGISFYAPEAREPIARAVEDAIRDGTPWDLELPFIRKDGERIWVRAVGEAEFEGGTARRLFGAFQDITDRVRRNDELRAAKQWMQMAARSGRVGLWSFDAEGGRVTWDDQMAENFGVSAAGRPTTLAEWQELMPASAARAVPEAIQRVLQNGERLEIEIDFTGADGGLRALKLTGEAHRDSAGELVRVQGACLDLTAERRLMLELQEQTSKMQVTLSSIGDGVITADTAGRVTWINEEAARLTGWSLRQAIGRPSPEVFAVFHDETGEPAADPIAACMNEGRMVSLAPESVLRRPDGSSIAVEDSAAPILDDGRNTIGAVLVFRDVTRQREHARDTEYRATHDILTGLLNRMEFESRLAERLADGGSLASHYLFFVDLDHFKRINDASGHETGDALLQEVGAVLRRTAGDGALVGRRGGDEFLVVVQAASADEARDLADAICDEITHATKALQIRSLPSGIGASIGAVDLGLVKGECGTCLRYAEVATYAAKKAGRGQCHFWADGDMSLQGAARQMTLVDRIERVTAEDAWVIHEQVIQPLDRPQGSGGMRELLIRFPVDEGCTAGAAEIVGTAERYGLMPAIDMWMCRKALELISGNIEAGREAVYFVNLSASSVAAQGFRHRLLELLQATPREVLARMCLEITETAMVENFDAASTFLAAIRELGLRVAIDDFGAGSSSFRYFQELPADYLKLDGSFIRNIHDPIALASVECFIRMAKAAGLETIAEHVECPDLLSFLAGLGVDHVQGFAIGRPMALAS
ncbi:EAL domain-containing protein [Roseibacterium sp. SDUM158017]|uniref:PAS domain-containing protein n=1 Tax=Roseicyclus salinarum TaxID=3036773 RepID=UPI002415021A|nr:PAS domain-containing protein [Roseibacterium sp. SDUM158017]MDG4647846.1 EAL domain-containing protein [Roseibacterium sp. SDUM158017]